LSPEQRVVIREKLVGCLSSEQLPDVRNKIGDAIAEIARQYTDNGTFGVSLGGYTTADEMINRRLVAGTSWGTVPSESVFRSRLAGSCIPNFHYDTKYY
jgi:hypothetical protein